MFSVWGVLSCLGSCCLRGGGFEVVGVVGRAFGRRRLCEEWFLGFYRGYACVKGIGLGRKGGISL